MGNLFWSGASLVSYASWFARSRLILHWDIDERGFWAYRASNAPAGQLGTVRNLFLEGVSLSMVHTDSRKGSLFGREIRPWG